MPHEKVWDRHNQRPLPGEKIGPEQNALIIGWSSGPDPLHDEAPDGWVQISASRPGLDARIHLTATGTDQDAVRLEVARLLGEALTEANAHVVTRSGTAGDVDTYGKLIDALVPHLGYAVGPRADKYAIQLDRDGCNRVIRHVRKGRDVAYGRDE